MQIEAARAIIDGREQRVLKSHRIYCNYQKGIASGPRLDLSEFSSLDAPAKPKQAQWGDDCIL
jgi:hypothetical protein